MSPERGGPVAAPRSMIQTLLRKWRCRICKRAHFLSLLMPGMDFGPVPGKKYEIPLVSEAYAQKVFEITRFRKVPRKGRPVAAPRYMIQTLLRKWRCQICKRGFFLLLLVAGMYFGPVPGKINGIPTVSGAYAQKVLEIIRFRDVRGGRWPHPGL